MKAYKLVILILFYTINVYAQNEPRLVLPVGHTARVASTSFSFDSKLIVTSSSDNTLCLWDLQSGKEINKLVGHGDLVNSAIFSFDNKFILSSSYDNTVRLWDVVKGEQILFFNHKDIISSISFSTDNKSVLTSSYDSTAIIFDVNSGKVLLKIKQNARILNAIFSSDNNDRFLTIAEDTTLCIWNTQSGLLLKKIKGDKNIDTFITSISSRYNCLISGDLVNVFETGTGELIHVLKGHTDEINFIDYNLDNNYLISLSLDSTARIWELKTGKEKQIIKYNNVFEFAKLSPDNKYLSTVSAYENPKIWDVESGKLLYELKGYSKTSFSTILSKNKKYILNNFWFDSVAYIRNIYNCEKTKIYGVSENAVFTSISNDNKKVVISSNENTLIYDFESRKKLNLFKVQENYSLKTKINSDYKFLITISEDSMVRIWDVESGELFKTLKHSAGVNSADFSFDNKKIVTTTSDTVIWIWDIMSGKLNKTLKDNKKIFHNAFFSLDDKFLISEGSSDLWPTKEWEICIWDFQSGKLIQTLKHSNYVIDCFFTLDKQKLVTICSDKMFIWNIFNGELIRIIEPKVSISKAVLSSDNRSILIGSNENLAQLYDFENGNLIQSFNGHMSSLTNVYFTLNNKQIITESYDNQTKIWDIETGKILYTYIDIEKNNWLAYDEHYRFDGTEGAINYLYLTCGLEVIDLAQVKDSLWVPGLVEKIMKGEEIKINDKPAPKLSDLNICDLTPQIEQLNKDEKGIFKYKITPRKGGLGETEIYINGNLTYSLKPSQLEKKLENKKEVYYLTISTDSLQSYMVGELNSENPILVKSKVKGAGIYGRGSTSTLIKTTKQEIPHFYGVFVGVNEYGNPSKEENDFRYKNLDFAKKDAEDLANTVEATAKTLFKENCHIYRLTSTLVNDSLPNKSNLIKVLNEIGMKANANDILYVFFAGHGDIIQKYTEKEIRFILQNADKKNLNSSSFGIDELTEWCQPKNIKA